METLWDAEEEWTKNQSPQDGREDKDNNDDDHNGGGDDGGDGGGD
jgi:hypothetical protein